MKVLEVIWALCFWACFWAFIAIKVAGTTFAAWSWWWVLLPAVPVLSISVARLGL